VMEKIKIGFGNKKILVNTRKLSYFDYFRGLMFKTKNSENLLFDFGGRWGIHSFFVFFSFLALWLDEKNKVVEWKVVKPFSSFVRPKKKFAKLIEIPLNDKNREVLAVFRR